MEEAQDPELTQLAQDVHPEKVMVKMKETERKFIEEEGQGSA